MKNTFSLYIIFFMINLVGFSQDSIPINNLQIHNSCLTAKEICKEGGISEILPDIKSCLAVNTPQYFKLNMSGAGTFQLNTTGHTGTYTLYGPMSDFGVNACQMITLGQVEEHTDSLTNSNIISHQQGFYILKVDADCLEYTEYWQGWGVVIDIGARMTNCETPPNCIDCISSFSPNPGKYILSAWVKGEAVNKNTSYMNPKIETSFIGDANVFSFAPTGLIIDDWQKIEGEVIVPPGATDIKIKLECQSGNCYFDDIRFVPLDGSMKSYVYDPISLRLVAELDERNYATFYEYDEEGKLIRVKKETEKGIMTIQENRNSIIKN